jgi:hypothetical protein
MHGLLRDRVLTDEVGLHERLERERSRITHAMFLMAESGMLPDVRERRSQSRAATARAWMTHIAAGVGHIWPDAPADLGDQVDQWFAANGERREILELQLAERLADGPIDDLDTRERRMDFGAAARWLMAAIGELCDPDGDGGPAFARRMSALLDGRDGEIGRLAADARVDDPDDERAAESAELMAHVNVTVAVLESELPAGSPPEG